MDNFIVYTVIVVGYLIGITVTSSVGALFLVFFFNTDFLTTLLVVAGFNVAGTCLYYLTSHKGDYYA